MSQTVLSEKLVKAETGEFDLQTVFQLALPRRRIKSPTDLLERLTNLRFLDLAYNDITSLQGLQNLCLLEHLNLVGNRLTSVRKNQMPVEELTALKTLRLQGNKSLSARVEDLDGVLAQGKLEHLSFQNIDGTDACAVCLKEDKYRDWVLNSGRLNCLKSLDYHRLHLPDLDTQIKQMTADALFQSLEQEAAADDSAAGGGGTTAGTTSASTSTSSSSSTRTAPRGAASTKETISNLVAGVDAAMQDLANLGTVASASSKVTERDDQNMQNALFAALKKSKDTIREVYRLVDQTGEVEAPPSGETNAGERDHATGRTAAAGQVVNPESIENETINGNNRPQTAESVV